MRLESVNVGRPRVLEGLKRAGATGICKQPVEGAASVTRLGAVGDAVMNTRYHGGPGQALYLYSTDDYAWWAGQGVETGAGVFGENLTVSGVESALLCIGDRLAIGDVELEVTAARIPCATFAARMGDPGFVKSFRDAGRPGAYLRVLREGEISAGREIVHLPFEGDRMSIGEHFSVSFSRRSREMAERLLALPISERDRADCIERLEEAD